MTDGRPNTQGKDDEISEASQRFYKVLILLYTLSPSIGNRRTSRSEWQRFLDELSWLCDERPGGKTVTSIAVSQTNGHGVFWIACNNTAEQGRVAFLRDIVQDLRQINDLPPAALESMAMSISSKAINRSFRRVICYVRRLGKKLQELDSLCTISEDVDLKMHICNMFQAHSQVGICLECFNFRYSQDFPRLLLNCDVQDAFAQKCWRSVRHLIGRLGSWHSATKIILALAINVPALIWNSTVRPVDYLKPVMSSFKPKDLTLTSAIEEALPDRNPDLAKQAMSAILEKNNLDLGQNFVQSCNERPFKPKVHAEAMMADHFFSRQLEFWDGDRYIGCSKPSCFCCSLYMKNHAGIFVDRPCHGNIWINWCPTYPVLADDTMRAVPTATLIRNMVERSKSEMDHLILDGLRPQEKQLESSTGISIGSIVTSSTGRSTETSLQIWR